MNAAFSSSLKLMEKFYEIKKRQDRIKTVV